MPVGLVKHLVSSREVRLGRTEFQFATDAPVLGRLWCAGGRLHQAKFHMCRTNRTVLLLEVVVLADLSQRPGDLVHGRLTRALHPVAGRHDQIVRVATTKLVCNRGAVHGETSRNIAFIYMISR